MEIQMHNCGFGDCFELKENNSRLFVDFGKKVKINNDNENHLLITHFHHDHYKGISKNMNLKVFKNIYLSPYFCHKNRKIHETYFAINISRQKYAQKAKRLYSLFDQIARAKSKDTKISYKSKGGSFSFCNHKFEVLNPPKDTTTNSRRLSKHIYNIINSKLFSNFIDKVIKVLKYIESGTDYDDIKNIDLEKSFEALCKHQATISVRNMLRKSNLLLLFDRVRYLFLKNMNECSIVFQGQVNKKNVLFCGDATPRIIRKIRSNFKRKYEVIKVPHHGTDHYYVQLPVSEHYFISNSNHKKWNISANVVSDILNNNGIIHCYNDGSTCDYCKQNKSTCGQCGGRGVLTINI